MNGVGVQEAEELARERVKQGVLMTEERKQLADARQLSLGAWDKRSTGRGWVFVKVRVLCEACVCSCVWLSSSVWCCGLCEGYGGPD